MSFTAWAQSHARSILFFRILVVPEWSQVFPCQSRCFRTSVFPASALLSMPAIVRPSGWRLK
jgi:hypothetical protein